MKNGPLFPLILAFATSTAFAAPAWMSPPTGSPVAATNSPEQEFPFPLAPLPTVATDPLGDDDNISPPAVSSAASSPRVDVIRMDAGPSGAFFIVKVTFSPATSMGDIQGVVQFDHDRQRDTGAAPLANTFGGAQDLGVEYSLYYANNEATLTPIDGTAVAVGVKTIGHTLQFSIPRNALPTHDGLINMGAVFGNAASPTDLVPAQGHILAGTPVRGAEIFGVKGSEVVCNNLTSSQSVIAPLNGATISDCQALGLIINRGDVVEQVIRGVAK